MIVFISSESALQIPKEMIHYGMTKTAQLAISRGLAETTAGTNVTVNTVLPGPTESEGVATFVEQMAAAQKISRARSREGILPQRAPFLTAEALRDASMKLRRWWRSYAVRYRRPPTAPRCGWTAAWFRPSYKPGSGWLEDRDCLARQRDADPQCQR